MVEDRRRLPDARTLKTSDGVEVVEAGLFPLPNDVQSRRVVCKLQESGGLWDIVFGVFRESVAKRDFDRAVRLHRARIGTALPYCRIERKAPRSSWLVSEFLENVVDLDSFVLTTLPRMGFTQQHRRSAIIEAIAELFCRLRQSGLYHRDMKASNLLLSDTTGNPQVHIVDVEGLSDLRPWRSQWKPLVRLAASLQQYPAISRADYARFRRTYLKKSGQDESSWRALFSSLDRQARRYARGSHRRKSGKLDGYAGDAIPRSA